MTHFLLSRYLLKAFVLEVAFYQPFKAPRGWDYFEFPHTYQEGMFKKTNVLGGITMSNFKIK
jgi:hypothetical protein